MERENRVKKALRLEGKRKEALREEPDMAMVVTFWVLLAYAVSFFVVGLLTYIFISSLGGGANLGIGRLHYHHELPSIKLNDSRF